MTNLGSLLKNKDTHLPTKVHIVKAVAFPVVTYRCESWTTKKAECWRTDAFMLWCWRRFESPWYSKEIKSVNPKGDKFWIFIGRTDAETEAPEKVFYAFFPVNDNTLNRQAIKWWDGIHCCSRTYNRSSTKPTEYCLYNKSGVRAVTKAARIVTTYWHTLISGQ